MSSRICRSFKNSIAFLMFSLFEPKFEPSERRTTSDFSFFCTDLFIKILFPRKFSFDISHDIVDWNIHFPNANSCFDEVWKLLEHKV